MSNETSQTSPAPVSGQDLFAEVTRLSKKRISEMLVRMIESAADYHNWPLSDEDAARVAKLIKHKQRIICSSFAFQLNRHFADFKAGDGSLSEQAGAHEWQQIGLSGSRDDNEIAELNRITKSYGEAFKDFDRSLLKRLQACLKRPRASIYENPLQVKRLCESFR